MNTFNVDYVKYTRGDFIGKNVSQINYLKAEKKKIHILNCIAEMQKKDMKINIPAVCKYSGVTKKFIFNHIEIAELIEYIDFSQNHFEEQGYNPNKDWERLWKKLYEQYSEDIRIANARLDIYHERYGISAYEAYAIIRKHTNFKIDI